MCHIADMRMMKSRRSVSNPPTPLPTPPCRKVRSWHNHPPHGYTGKQTASRCGTCYDLAEEIGSHPPHQLSAQPPTCHHAYSALIHTASVCLHCLSLTNNVIESTTHYTITYKTLRYCPSVSATEWIT